jgi:hypothetical protein
MRAAGAGGWTIFFIAGQRESARYEDIDLSAHGFMAEMKKGLEG